MVRGLRGEGSRCRGAIKNIVQEIEIDIVVAGELDRDVIEPVSAGKHVVGDSCQLLWLNQSALGVVFRYLMHAVPLLASGQTQHPARMRAPILNDCLEILPGYSGLHPRIT